MSLVTRTRLDRDTIGQRYSETKWLRLPRNTTLTMFHLILKWGIWNWDSISLLMCSFHETKSLLSAFNHPLSVTDSQSDHSRYIIVPILQMSTTHPYHRSSLPLCPLLSHPVLLAAFLSWTPRHFQHIQYRADCKPFLASWTSWYKFYTTR